MKNEDQAYYSILEFADILKVHPNTIRNSIKNGHIAAFKINKGKKSMYRIASSELQRLAIINLNDVIDEIKRNDGIVNQ